MRTGRKRTSKLEVDHTVADGWWKDLVKSAIESKLKAFVGTDEERASVAPDDFESSTDAVAFINLLGNCSLLEKSFNISKGKEPMRIFLQDVHEFKKGDMNMNEWESALSLSQTLTMPTDSTMADIKKAVLERDAMIRKELLDFVAGSKTRTDI